MSPMTASGAEALRTFRHSTPSPEDRRLEAWVSVVGHHVSREYHTSRTREEALLMYCIEGRGSLRLGQVDHHFSQGDVVLQPAHLNNICTLDPEDGADVWWIIFGGAYSHTLLDVLGLTPVQPCIQVGVDGDLLGDFRHLYGLFEAKSPTTHLDASERLIGLLMRLMRLQKKREWKASNPLEYVHYLVEDVEQMATAAGYSKHHFIRQFKAATGITPWQYVLHLKIDKAKDLLLTTHDPIKQVAQHVGISNPLYFSRLFRKIAGVSPSQFRKRRD